MRTRCRTRRSHRRIIYSLDIQIARPVTYYTAKDTVESVVTDGAAFLDVQIWDIIVDVAV